MGAALGGGGALSKSSVTNFLHRWSIGHRWPEIGLHMGPCRDNTFEVGIRKVRGGSTCQYDVNRLVDSPDGMLEGRHDVFFNGQSLQSEKGPSLDVVNRRDVLILRVERLISRIFRTI